MSTIGGIGSGQPSGGTDAVGGATAPAAPTAAIALSSPRFKDDPTFDAIARGSATLERGARGASVKTLQEALLSLGIPVSGGADGIFGSGTASALAAFQRQKGLAASGRLDQATLGALDAAVAAAAPGGPTTVLLASAAFKNDPTFEAIARGSATLERGARGPAVRKLQEGLLAAGIPVPGGADGVFGTGTQNAILAFQRQKGIAATGKLDQATLAALDRALASGGTTGPGGTGGTPAPTNARFANDPTIARVLRGETTIGSGARGAHVAAIQQAFLDIGYKLPLYGADGSFGGEAATAVKRFQRDMGLPQTGRVDKATLEKLAAIAPPPGKELERFPEYDKLFEDGRLDVTLAIGYDEGGSHESTLWKTQRGLQDQGFRRLNPESMSAADRARLGVGADRYERGATYYTKQITDPVSNKPVDIVVKLIHPGSAASPEEVRDMFKRALERDEVVNYDGHARYGTGPDFDAIDSGRGNFVMDKTGGPTGHPHSPLTDALADKPDTMLSGLRPFPGKYQLLYFNACTTENYMPNLRDPAKFPGRSPANTDILGTTIASYIATGADNTLGFVKMLASRGSINSFVEESNKREADLTQHFIETGVESDKGPNDVKRANALLFESGFADNAGNRVR